MRVSKSQMFALRVNCVKVSRLSYPMPLKYIMIVIPWYTSPRGLAQATVRWNTELAELLFFGTLVRVAPLGLGVFFMTFGRVKCTHIPFFFWKGVLIISCCWDTGILVVYSAFLLLLLSLVELALTFQLNKFSLDPQRICNFF